MTRYRPHLIVVVATLATLWAFFSTVSGQEWLTNGGFESGTSGWQLRNGTPTACEAHEGNGAFGVAVAGGSTAVAEFVVFGPLPVNDYTFSGWTRIVSGDGTAKANLVFIDEMGLPSGNTVYEGLAAGPAYTAFALTSRAQTTAESARITLTFVATEAAVYCVDSLALTSETPPTPTPTATSTATATPTSTPSPTSTTAPIATVPVSTATSTPTATPSSTATATLTPTPTATASTTPAPSATPSPSATPGPSFVFTNGGFEEGLTGWSKYGGTLSTSSDALTGATAGLLTSTTESTKWAYQAVHVDPAQHYEFSAHVSADGGVKEAYLRISWYPTGDASGPALSTSDSTHRTGPGGYVYLSTGAVRPPVDAASARLRVVLAPGSAAAASVIIDDAAFGTASAPTPTPTASPSVTPSPSPTRASGTATATATFAPLGALDATITDESEPDEPGHRGEFVSLAVASDASDSTSPALSATTAAPLVAEVAGSRSTAHASAASPQASARSIIRPTSDENALWPWIAGVALLTIGLGGAYIQNRRRVT